MAAPEPSPGPRIASAEPAHGRREARSHAAEEHGQAPAEEGETGEHETSALTL
jgi:hypothetical protein